MAIDIELKPCAVCHDPGHVVPPEKFAGFVGCANWGGCFMPYILYDEKDGPEKAIRQWNEGWKIAEERFAAVRAERDKWIGLYEQRDAQCDRALLQAEAFKAELRQSSIAARAAPTPEQIAADPRVQKLVKALEWIAEDERMDHIRGGFTPTDGALCARAALAEFTTTTTTKETK